MDIEYQNTPPKRNKNEKKVVDFSTPPNKTTPKDSQTPKKNKVRFQTPERMYQSPPSHKKQLSQEMSEMMMQTPPKRGENPESKKISKKNEKQQSTYKPCKSPAQWLTPQAQNQITPFLLSRLETDYKFIKYLGQGNFSKVGLYQSRLTQENFAIKTTQISLMSLNQIQALGSLSIFNQKSKHIIKYYHSWIQQDNLYIVMQYCEGSLAKMYQQKFSENEKSIEEMSLKQILKQSLLGLKCMHDHGMVHLDIKPDNLLMLTDNKKEINMKIADLGLCRVTRIKKWSDLDQGDSRYLAKQILNYHQGIDLTKADIFSLGMSLFQGTILQDLPNNGDQWLKIRQQGIGKYLDKIQGYSPQFKQILTKMTSPNQYDRPSCDQLLGCSYFNPQKQTSQSKRLSRFMKNSQANSRKRESSL